MKSFLFLSVLAFAQLVRSQERLPLPQALDYFTEDQNSQFSFDAELLKLIPLEMTFTTADITVFMEEVAEQLPMRIEKVDEEFYTVNIVTSTYFLTATDSSQNKPISKEMGMYLFVNGQPVSIRAQDNGWQFEYKPSISDTLEIFSLGFKRQLVSFSELVQSKKLSVSLALKIVELDGILIEDYLTKGINLDPSNHSIKVKVKDLPLLPGETDGDIFASIAALPGITNPDGRAGNIFIRGSESDQTLILFDNIPVYHRGHYYGTISPYNPKIIDNLEVYRSGFHSRLGDRVGGAILINSDQEQPTTPLVGAGANTLYGMGYFKVPINDKIGLSFGARHSYPSNFQSPKLEAISQSVFAATSLVNQSGEIIADVSTTFEDYHGKIMIRPSEKDRLSISGIYTNTGVGYNVPLPPPSPPISVVNQFKNVGFNFDWIHEMNRDWTSTFSATLSDYKYGFFNKVPMLGDFRSVNELKDANLKQEFGKSNKNVSYEIGFDYKWQEVRINYKNQLQSDQSPYAFDNTTVANSFSPYANLDITGWKKWYVQLGIRSTYYSLLEDLSISPRLLLNYDLTNQMTLKGSTGWYNQYLSQVKNLEFSGGGFDSEVWTLADNQLGHIIRGTQSMIGGVINQNKWILDVEAFVKTADNITLYENRKLDPISDYITMDQTTHGIDILVKRQVGSNISMWAGYSFHDSEIKIDTTNEASYASKYVQPDVWTLGGTFKQNRWKVSAGWQLKSGLNAQSLDIVYARLIFEQMNANRPPGAPPPPNPFADQTEDRYPKVQNLDISTSYTVPKTEERKWQATFGLSLINVLNQENLVDRVFRGMDGFADRYSIGFAPNLMVTVEW